jgi:hypothetical protein
VDKAKVVLRQVHHVLTKAASLSHDDPNNVAAFIKEALRTIHDEHGTELRRLAAELEEAGDEADSTPGSSTPRHTAHSEDFHSVSWYGQAYTFTHQQAAAVKLLWQAWENGTPDLGQAYLLEKIDSDGSRLRDIFKGKDGMHPAWGTMIVESKKGVFRLSPQRE